MEAFDLSAQLALPELPGYLKSVETHLLQLLDSSQNPNVISARRLITATGKRLRPALLLAVVTSQGVPISKKIIQAGCALELIHIGSLVHDDLMDGADSRWGIPTVNVQEGVHEALLVGDYLFALAHLVASELGAKISTCVAQTVIDLCDGQRRELTDLHATNRTLTSYEQTIRGKTGVMFATACRIGALCTNLSTDMQEKISNFGYEFGNSFQLIDDVLDVFSNPRLIGKPFGTDMNEGVFTMPILESLKSPYRNKMLQLIKKNRGDMKALQQILIDSGAAKFTIDKAKEHTRAASKLLETFPGKPAVRNGLQSLPLAFLDWQLQNLLAKPWQFLADQ